MMYDQLRHLGWDNLFTEQAQELNLTGQRPARIAAVDREQFLVVDESGEYRARLAGRFLYQAGQSSDFPCVGDWVALQHDSADDFGIIHDILPRSSFLRRKAAGETSDSQMIAANIDAALIVQSCHFDFNINRLERYLVMVRDGRVEPLIILTKTDLVTPDTLHQIMSQISGNGISAPVIPLCNLTGVGVDAVRNLLRPGKTYCLLGSSGVGKSTLINQLLGNQAAATGMVSATGEGRHTTVRRELIRLENGAMLIDNPGMREFGIFGSDDGLEESFADIYALAARCKFGDCSHANEPGCAVLQSLESGDLTHGHYRNFLKLRSEAEFHDLSQHEKRQKDKDFGRMVKSVKKELKHKR